MLAVHQVPAAAARRDASALLQAAGLAGEVASCVAAKLVESDLLGHATHGLANLPMYLERVQSGAIATDGDIGIVSDTGATFAWQANRLAGAWVLERAVQQALERGAQHPVVTVTIANCSHVGSLQTYLESIAHESRLALLMVSDPSFASVAPFGGVDAAITTNPFAAGIPTRGDPILIDQCTSVASNSFIMQCAAAGKTLPGAWLIDACGRPTDDPRALLAQPGATISPLGGAEFGYKGFAFGLVVEAFALALSGYGRRNAPTRGGQGVFLQIIDPAAFAGRDAFLDETTELVRRCKSSQLAPGHSEIRLPGERALREKARQLNEGLTLSAALITTLLRWAAQLGTPQARFHI